MNNAESLWINGKKINLIEHQNRNFPIPDLNSILCHRHCLPFDRSHLPSLFFFSLKIVENVFIRWT